MAQDTNFRPTRSGDDSYSRDPARPSSGRNNDPLAELARLIGQDDPFVALGRSEAPPSWRTSPAQSHDQPKAATPDWLGRPGAQAQETEWDDANDDPPPIPAAHDYDAADYDSGYQDEPDYNDPQYATDGQEHEQSDAYYDDGQSAYDEEGYDEAPVGRRRWGLLAVATVTGFAIAATAGVFGYGAWTSQPTPAGQPPVIKAAQSPTKIIPTQSSSDNQLSKIYDRIGDRGGEQVVPREEQPVDPRNTVRATPSVTGSIGTPGSTDSVLPPLPAQPAPTGDTKRVRTETIRPTQAASPPATPPPARVANVAPAPAPSRSANPPPPAPSRSANAQQSTPWQPISSGTPSSAEGGGGGGGGASGGSYVQISSQLSEADAQASLKALQAKYPNQLGDQPAIVRRVDLSDKGKGIVYRALVGPFSTGGEAKQFCDNFKTAGGKCLVSLNN